MLNSFVFKYLLGFERCEKRRPFVFNNLLGSFGKIRNRLLIPFRKTVGQGGRPIIVLRKFGTVGTIEKGEKVYFRCRISNLG